MEPGRVRSLGQRFDRRGRRLDEQIELLRTLWTTPSVSFEGTFDVVTGAGLAPLPVQRPIPIWFGGSSEAAYRRIGRLADGWFPQIRPGDDLDNALSTIRRAAEAAGRSADGIGMEGRVTWDPKDADRFGRQVERWRATGATHLSINTMQTGQRSVEDHIRALELAASVAAVG